MQKVLKYSAKGQIADRLRQRVDAPEQIFLARHSSDLIAQLPVFEKEQRRNGANVVLKGKTLVLVHVHFRDLDRAGLLLRDLVQQWRDHFAGAAPFRPEIDDYGLVAVGDFTVKIGFIELDGGRILHQAK